MSHDAHERALERAILAYIELKDARRSMGAAMSAAIAAFLENVQPSEAMETRGHEEYRDGPCAKDMWRAMSKALAEEMKT